MNRRTFLQLATGVLASSALTACAQKPSSNQSEEATSEVENSDEALAAEETLQQDEASQAGKNVRIAALKGPTAMGLAKFMHENAQGNSTDNNYSFEILAAPDELTPKIAQGEVELAALPANLASVLYNKTQGKVKVLAINTLGVLYICEKGNSLSSIADLAGKTIYASGKGATPEYALSYILEQNDLSDVTVEWKSEHAECVAALASDEHGVAMLPQPFVTTAQMQDDTIQASLDLTKEWEAVTGGESALVTGVMVAVGDTADDAELLGEQFLPRYRESVEFANTNVSEAASYIEEADIVPAKVAERALPACNIVCITGDEMKSKLGGYLEVLHSQNPEAVGGALPEADFYLDY